MPNLLLDLEVDRVDLVDEGANSAAFIKLYKRKERNENMDFKEIISKLKPEHAKVIEEAIAKAKDEVPEDVATELQDTKEELAKTKEALAEIEKKADKEPESKPSEEEVIKSLDPEVQKIFKSLKAQKEAAEQVAKRLNEQRAEEEAIAKAKELKAIPVEEEKLIEVAKSVTPEVFEILKSAASAIEEGGILDEIGKSKEGEGVDAWSQIQKKADEIAKRENITIEKAIAEAVKENPDLYREYLNGGVK